MVWYGMENTIVWYGKYRINRFTQNYNCDKNRIITTIITVCDYTPLKIKVTFA